MPSDSRVGATGCAPSRLRAPASESYRPLTWLSGEPSQAAPLFRISPSRAYPYWPGQVVLPTSRWPKIVGSVTLTPAAYFDVPLPPEVSVVVPYGLTL